MNFPVITGERMREIDRKVTETIGVERIMAIVASRTAEFVKYYLKLSKSQNICFIASKGNNGGDAIGAASILHGWGYDISLYITHPEEELGEEAKIQYELFRHFGGKIVSEIPHKNSVLVDGIFGTGLIQSPYGQIADIIEQINVSSTRVLSIDIPSGLHATAGEIFNPCVQADRTLTYHVPKKGLVETAAQEKVGELYVAETGLTFSEFPEIQESLEKLYEETLIVKLS